MSRQQQLHTIANHLATAIPKPIPKAIANHIPPGNRKPNPYERTDVLTNEERSLGYPHFEKSLELPRANNPTPRCRRRKSLATHRDPTQQANR